ncbi:MAG: DUF6106 family protein [Muribaculum sp.]|nr:DUF6106 family protein [Muribaculum sp.]
MSDTYVECLVPAKQSGAAKAATVLLIGLTVVLGLAMFVFPVALILAVLTGGAAYFVNLYTNVEYEYLYLDKELTVDKILARSKRKRAAVYSLERMEVFAPINSHHLDNYRKRNVKSADYSIGQTLTPDERYVMYYEGDAKVILSPSAELVKVLKTVAPRKVFSE